MNRYFWLLFSLTVAVCVALDQSTKYLVLYEISPGERITVIPGLFNLTLTFNPGAAFGFMADLADGTRQLVLGLTTLIAFAVVIYFVFVEYAGDKLARLALASILGGAIGNIIDRVRIGMVVDFLDFYISDYRWPAFNLADSFICCGVAVLLFRKPLTRWKKDATPEQEVTPKEVF